MKITSLFIVLWAVAGAVHAENLDLILSEIEEFEGDHDPKCYATASRLEDFMYGTPLTDDARFQKNKLQQRLAEYVWRKLGKANTAVGADAVEKAFKNVIKVAEGKDGDRRLTFPNGVQLEINATDLRQYGSVAYSLRAILAVQQDTLLDPEKKPLPVLSEAAIDTLKERLDLATLALLKEADAYARAHDEFEITKSNLNRSWLSLFKKTDKATRAEPAVAEIKPSSEPPAVLARIIQQKVASYAEYNQITNQLFVRNMQVYFARLSWPENADDGERFRSSFVEALIGYGIELYSGVMNIAVENGHSTITEEDVARFVQHFTPYRVDEYEDVEYFPTLSLKDRVTLESYDLDAFRDSGIHWVYLGHALNSDDIQIYLDADPFAAELLAENMAQFGVLLLRVTGLLGQELGQQRLSADLLVKGVARVQELVNKNIRVRSGTLQTNITLSSAEELPPAGQQDGGDTWFADHTEAAGLTYEHRSSDWLNRLLRSYLRRDEETGVITIPPAFGGSGVAAEDINNDGLPDILILSGLGNRLYLNQGDGRFEDITEAAGIKYLRAEDKQPGEPRQPLIADLDNDGWQDIVITYVDDDHRVYRNKGDGSFEDLTATAKLGGSGLVGGPATVFDYNNDGLLDIYITYFGDYLRGVLPTLKRRNDNGLPNKLFKNNGAFQFEEVTAGVENTGWGQAVAHTDFNGDNLQDLIVGNDFGVNAYYLNQGNGQFKNIAAEIGTDKPSYTMNVGLADLNQDLLPDIYISNIVTMNKDEKYVLPNEDTQMKFNIEKLANMRVIEANDLFISARGENGTLTYHLNRELVGRGYNSTGWSWDADFFDADNDGDEDLYVLNGMNEYNLYSSENSYAEAGLDGGSSYVPVSAKESNVFFINSNGKLNNTSAVSGLDLLGNSRSAAYLDYDNDGDMDIVVNNYHGPVKFYRNKADRLSTNWIKLKLVGDPQRGVSRDAIGAKVIFTLPNGTTIWREVHGSIGYMSVHPKQVHTGLGKFNSTDIRIVWPNGVESQMDQVPANNAYRLEMTAKNAE